METMDPRSSASARANLKQSLRRDGDWSVWIGDELSPTKQYSRNPSMFWAST